MLTTITNTTIDPNGSGIWVVQGEIFGQPTTVFTGTLLECARWAAANA